MREEISKSEMKKQDPKIRKQAQANAKLIEKKLKEIQEEINPHLDISKQGQDLQINDFSVEDKLRA